MDAAWIQKTYEWMDGEGKPWKVTQSFFGYKVPLLVNSSDELPLAYEVSSASKHDLPAGKELLRKYVGEETLVSKRMKTLGADRGYDDGAFARELLERDIHPIIDMGTLWREEKERLFDEGFKNLYETERGGLLCSCPETGTRGSLVHDGY